MIIVTIIRLRLAYKVIIGIVIGVVAIFAISIAAVFVIGVSMVNEYQDEIIEKVIELNEAQIIENVNSNPDRIVQQDIVPSTPDCDKSYPDFCIMPFPPDLDCDDIPASNFRVVGDDAHGLDADNDGIGCEVGSPTAPVSKDDAVLAAENCSSSYPDFCIANYPPDLNCGDIGYSNFKVIGRDPHGFDRDNDGIGCEG